MARKLDEIERLLVEAEGELARLNDQRSRLLMHISELQAERAATGRSSWSSRR